MYNHIVYALVNREDNSAYIGVTNNFAKRLLEHRNKLNNTAHECMELQLAWVVFGANKFYTIELAYCSYEMRRTVESYCIAEWPGRIYNNYNSQSGMAERVYRQLKDL